MLGAFDAVVAHLALDDVRGGAKPPDGEQLGEDLLGCPGLCVSQRARGKNPGASRRSAVLPAGCG